MNRLHALVQRLHAPEVAIRASRDELLLACGSLVSLSDISSPPSLLSSVLANKKPFVSKGSSTPVLAAGAFLPASPLPPAVLGQRAAQLAWQSQSLKELLIVSRLCKALRWTPATAPSVFDAVCCALHHHNKDTSCSASTSSPQQLEIAKRLVVDQILQLCEVLAVALPRSTTPAEEGGASDEIAGWASLTLQHLLCSILPEVDESNTHSLHSILCVVNTAKEFCVTSPPSSFFRWLTSAVDNAVSAGSSTPSLSGEAEGVAQQLGELLLEFESQETCPLLSRSIEKLRALCPSATSVDGPVSARRLALWQRDDRELTTRQRLLRSLEESSKNGGCSSLSDLVAAVRLWGKLDIRDGVAVNGLVQQFTLRFERQSAEQGDVSSALYEVLHHARRSPGLEPLLRWCNATKETVKHQSSGSSTLAHIGRIESIHQKWLQGAPPQDNEAYAVLEECATFRLEQLVMAMEVFATLPRECEEFFRQSLSRLKSRSTADQDENRSITLTCLARLALVSGNTNWFLIPVSEDVFECATSMLRERVRTEACIEDLIQVTAMCNDMLKGGWRYWGQNKRRIEGLQGVLDALIQDSSERFFDLLLPLQHGGDNVINAEAMCLASQLRTYACTAYDGDRCIKYPEVTQQTVSACAKPLLQVSELLHRRCTKAASSPSAANSLGHTMRTCSELLRLRCDVPELSTIDVNIGACSKVLLRAIERDSSGVSFASSTSSAASTSSFFAQLAEDRELQTSAADLLLTQLDVHSVSMDWVTERLGHDIHEGCETSATVASTLDPLLMVALIGWAGEYQHFSAISKWISRLEGVTREMCSLPTTLAEVPARARVLAALSKVTQHVFMLHSTRISLDEKKTLIAVTAHVAMHTGHSEESGNGLLCCPKEFFAAKVHALLTVFEHAAVGDGGMGSSELLVGCIIEATRCLAYFEPKDVATMLLHLVRSQASSGYLSAAVTQALNNLVLVVCQQMNRMIAGWSPDDIASAVFGLGEIPGIGSQLSHQVALLALAEHTVDHAEAFHSGSSIARMLLGFAKAHITTRALFRVFSQRLSRRSIFVVMKLPDISCAMQAFGLARFVDKDLFDAFGRKVLARWDDLTPADVTMVACSFSRNLLLHHGLYNALGDRAATILESFPPDAAAKVVGAFGHVGVSHPLLAQSATTAVDVDSLDAVSASTMLIGLWQMNSGFDAPGMERLANRIADLDAEGVDTAQLIGLCSVVQDLGWRHGRLLKVIGDRGTSLAELSGDNASSGEKGSSNALSPRQARIVLDTLARFSVHHRQARERLTPSARSVSREVASIDEEEKRMLLSGGGL